MRNAVAAERATRVPFLDLKLQFSNLRAGLEETIWPLLASANAN